MVFLFLGVYIYNFCNRSRQEGRCNDLNGFFSSPWWKRKPSQNLKNGWNHRNQEQAAIFVKNLKCYIFQVFRPFFFPTQTKKNCKVGLMKGREENLFVLPRLWKPYLFYHTFWKLKGLFYGTLYHLSLSLVLSLQKIFLICFSEPFSFSTNVLFF